MSDAAEAVWENIEELDRYPLTPRAQEVIAVRARWCGRMAEAGMARTGMAGTGMEPGTAAAQPERASGHTNAHRFHPSATVGCDRDIRSGTRPACRRET